MADARAPKVPSPWLFAVSGIPYGVGGTFGALVMPYLAKQSKIELSTIGWYGTLLLVPPIVQFLYAPIVDIGLPRRHWLILVSVLGAACFFGALQMDLAAHPVPFLALAVAGQLISGLSGSCNGGLLAQLMPITCAGRRAPRSTSATCPAARSRARSSSCCSAGISTPGSSARRWP